MKALSVVGTTVATLLVAGGCSSAGSDETAGSDSAGEAAAAPTVTIRVGTDDSPGRPAADQIEHFAERVQELSEGTIEIEPVWSANDGGPGDDWDQRVARKVIAGELDGALVPARAWDTEGVETFRPLHAPFLVDSHELLAEVISGSLADRMLDGLDGSGVVGLAILPEGLRHPFGVDEPLLGPGDYDGAVLRVPTSATSQALFEALGAQTNDDSLDRAVHDGVESGLVLKPGGIATGNVTFFPKANVLVLNEETMEGLADADREVLVQAAANTLSWAVESFPSESSLAEAFCASGGVIVHASDTDVRTLQEATTSVLAAIRADSRENAEALDEITALKGSLPTAEPPPPCGEPPETAATGEESVLNGVYRFELSADEIRAAVPSASQHMVDINVGTWTMFLEDGSFRLEHQGLTEDTVDEGTYRVEGQRVGFFFADSTAPETVDWSRADDGSLTLEIVTVPEQFRHVYSEPWIAVPELSP